MTRPGGAPGDGAVIEARDGSLEGLVSSNSASGEGPELTYALRLVLPPPAGQPAGEARVLILPRLRLDARSWRDLAGRSFDLASRVRLAGEPSSMGDPGLTDGTLDTGGEHRRLQVESLTFGEASDGALPVRGSFQLEPYGGSASEHLRVVATVTLGPVVIRGDRNRRRPPGGREARRLADQHLDLDDYEVDRRGEATAYRPRTV